MLPKRRQNWDTMRHFSNEEGWVRVTCRKGFWAHVCVYNRGTWKWVRIPPSQRFMTTFSYSICRGCLLTVGYCSFVHLSDCLSIICLFVRVSDYCLSVHSFFIVFCFFLRQFDPPHSREVTPFLSNKPTLRKVTSWFWGFYGPTTELEGHWVIGLTESLGSEILSGSSVLVIGSHCNILSSSPPWPPLDMAGILSPDQNTRLIANSRALSSTLIDFENFKEGRWESSFFWSRAVWERMRINASSAPIQSLSSFDRALIFVKVTSQNPYMEDFVGKPWVYTIDVKNHGLVEEAIKDIVTKEVRDSFFVLLFGQ